MTKSYKESGVDTEAGDQWVEQIAGKFGASDKKLLSSFDSYSAVYDIDGTKHLALSCDGVGTKVLWSKMGLGTVAQVAQDLVAMNVNDLICVGATPTLFMDYIALGSLEKIKEGGFLDSFLEGLSSSCAKSGSLLVGGETAEMPGVYAPEAYDVAGFAVGFLESTEFINPTNIKPGNHLYGWRSSGPHSNGFSWLRKLFDAQKDSSFIKEHLMPPTRLYVEDFLKLKKQVKVNGAFHITGSGFLNLLRFNNKDFSLGFDLSELKHAEAPEWAVELQKRSGASTEDMYSSMNMGWGFVLAVDESQDKESLKAHGLTKLGVVTEGNQVKVADVTLT